MARKSILIFAALLTFMSAGGMLTILVIQLPATPQSDVMPMIRLGMAAFYVVLAAIGVWWLVLFNRSRTKEYFAGQVVPASERARPLSVSVIAWLLLISGALTASSAIFRLPAIMFGIVLTGWATLPLCGLRRGADLPRHRSAALAGREPVSALSPISALTLSTLRSRWYGPATRR